MEGAEVDGGAPPARGTSKIDFDVPRRERPPSPAPGDRCGGGGRWWWAAKCFVAAASASTAIAKTEMAKVDVVVMAVLF